jgi:hypothetical protein
LAKHRLNLARGVTALMERDIVPPGPANTEYANASRAAAELLKALTPGLTRYEVNWGHTLEDDKNRDSQYAQLPAEWQNAISDARIKQLQKPQERLKIDQELDYEINQYRIRGGQLGGEPTLQKDDAVRLLVNSALRYMRLNGPHSALPAQAMAPMHMRRKVMSEAGGAVRPYFIQNDPRAVKHMQINSSAGDLGDIIAHEAVHEKQVSSRTSVFSKRPESGVKR